MISFGDTYKSLENVTHFKSFWDDPIQSKCVHEEISISLNACYYSGQNHLSPILLSKNMKIKDVKN